MLVVLWACLRLSPPKMWAFDIITAVVGVLYAWSTVIAVGVALISAVWAYRKWKKEQLRKKWNSAGKDVVVLHTIGRGYTCPHMSPFGLKLETYLRMSGFEIQIDEDSPMSTKNKTPWITLNGIDLTDSQLIIEHLSSIGKGFSNHLTEAQKAVARAFQVMVDEHLYWGLVKWRYLSDPDVRALELSAKYPAWIKYALPLLKGMLNKALNAQGIGRHTDSEILSMMRNDMESLSTYLGEKPYLMGDQPCEVDCSVFGQLGQFLWNAPDSPYYAMVTDDYPNLHQYCLRMKEKFWPDWDQVLDKRN